MKPFRGVLGGWVEIINSSYRGLSTADNSLTHQQVSLFWKEIHGLLLLELLHYCSLNCYLTWICISSLFSWGAEIHESNLVKGPDCAGNGLSPFSACGTVWKQTLMFNIMIPFVNMLRDLSLWQCSKSCDIGHWMVWKALLART